MTKLRDAHGAKYDKFIARIQATRAKLPLSSVVLVTKPYHGGQQYSGHESGMGEHDEFGFPSGLVTIADLDHVLIVKNKKVIETLSLPEAEKLAARLSKKLWLKRSVVEAGERP